MTEDIIKLYRVNAFAQIDTLINDFLNVLPRSGFRMEKIEFSLTGIRLDQEENAATACTTEQSKDYFVQFCPGSSTTQKLLIVDKFQDATALGTGGQA